MPADCGADLALRLALQPIDEPPIHVLRAPADENRRLGSIDAADERARRTRIDDPVESPAIGARSAMGEGDSRLGFRELPPDPASARARKREGLGDRALRRRRHHDLPGAGVHANDEPPRPPVDADDHRRRLAAKIDGGL